jgi:hypothetical protein
MAGGMPARTMRFPCLHACMLRRERSMRLTHVCPSAGFLSQGADGTGRGAAKLAQLKSNSNFVRNQLRAMGCEVLGDEDSPVRDAHHAHSCTRAVIIDASSHHQLISHVCSLPAQVMPIMLYNPGKIPAFSREARTRTRDTQHAFCDAHSPLSLR